jgi:hypothetical protein
LATHGGLSLELCAVIGGLDHGIGHSRALWPNP